MRLYNEVDVPLDKRSSRSISSHTLLQHPTKRLYIGSGWEPERRSRYLSTFLSHVVENPNFDLGTSRLFCHIWWRIRAWISVPLVFFYHIWWRTWASISVLFDFFCHIWWRTRYLLSFLSQIRGHADEYTNNRLNIIKCNVFLQGKWNNCLLNFSLVLVTPRIFFKFCNKLWCLKLSI